MTILVVHPLETTGDHHGTGDTAAIRFLCCSKFQSVIYKAVILLLTSLLKFQARARVWGNRRKYGREVTTGRQTNPRKQKWQEFEICAFIFKFKVLQNSLQLNWKGAGERHSF